MTGLSMEDVPGCGLEEEFETFFLDDFEPIEDESDGSDANEDFIEIEENKEENEQSIDSNER